VYCKYLICLSEQIKCLYKYFIDYEMVFLEIHNLKFILKFKEKLKCFMNIMICVSFIIEKFEIKNLCFEWIF
jgi:hypothetical protein